MRNKILELPTGGYNIFSVLEILKRTPKSTRFFVYDGINHDSDLKFRASIARSGGEYAIEMRMRGKELFFGRFPHIDAELTGITTIWNEYWVVMNVFRKNRESSSFRIPLEVYFEE